MDEWVTKKMSDEDKQKVFEVFNNIGKTWNLLRSFSLYEQADELKKFAEKQYGIFFEVEKLPNGNRRHNWRSSYMMAHPDFLPYILNKDGTYTIYENTVGGIVCPITQDELDLDLKEDL